MEKILYNRLLRPGAGCGDGGSLALGVASSAWPAAGRVPGSKSWQRRASPICAPCPSQSQNWERTGLAALIKTPMQGNDFKKMSGLLTEVRDAAGYDRIWADSPEGWQDHRTVRQQLPGYRYSRGDLSGAGQRVDRPLAEKLGSGVSGLLSGKTEDAYTKSPVETGSDTPMLGIAAVVRDKNGTPAAALVAQFPAADIDFTQLGFVDLGLVSWLGFLLFALSLALLVLLSRLRKKFPKPTPPEPTEPEPSDFTAEGFESAPAELPEAPAADQPSCANFDPMTGEPHQ